MAQYHRLNINPFKPEFTLSSLFPISCRNSQFVVNEDDIKWVKIKENHPVLVNQCHGNFHFKTLVVGK